MKIPIIESNSRLNDPQIVQPDIGLYTNGGKAFSEVGKQLDSITQQFKKVQDFQERTQSSNILRDELDNITAQADADDDPTNMPKYEEAINMAIDKNANTISDKINRMEARQDFINKGYAVNVDIVNKFRTKSVEKSQNQAFIDFDGYKREFSVTADPVKKQEILQRAIGSLDRSVASGVFSAEAANALRKQAMTDWPLEGAMVDVDGAPDQVLNTLDSGGYQDIQGSDRKMLRDYAYSAVQRKEALNKQVQEKEYTDTKIEFQKKLSDGSLRPTDVIEAAKSGRLPPDSFEKYMNVATKGIDISARTDGSTYASLLNEVTSLGTYRKDKLVDSQATAKRIADFRLRVIESNQQGKLSETDMRKMLDGTQKLFDEKVRKEVEKQKNWGDHFSNFVNRMNDTFSDDVEERKRQYMGEYFDRVIVNGEPAQSVVDEIKFTEYREKNKWITGVPKEGQVFKDKNGVKMKVFPDRLPEPVDK